MDENISTDDYIKKMLQIDEIKIDDHIFTIKKNIKNIKNTCPENINEYEYYEEPINPENVQIFFLFETIFHSAFGHWIYESAIFLPYVKYFKNCKILMNKNPNRGYKTAFLKLFNLEDRIVFCENEVEYSPNISYENIPPNNICIICDTIHLISYNENTTKENKKFEKLLEKYYNELTKIHDFDYTKTIDNLFFPRSKIENYTPNERTMNYDKTYKLLENKEYIEYDTINTTNFKDQIQLLASSKNIYLDFGSSFNVNSFFCKNSNIYVLNVCQGLLSLKFEKILLKIIEKKNNNKLIFY